MDPATQYREIAEITATLEFPWDITQALGLALFRTYAVPSIGALLARTGEFTERTQKRYDDTGLILDVIAEDGFEGDAGRQALRRMNQMHGAYGISNDDLRYVLSTFVVVPARWLDAYGWRPLSETERVASANYYRELGRRMGIKNIPATHEEFAQLLDSYEAAHFAYDPGARAVADATLNLLATFPPFSVLPVRMVRRTSRALLDPPLLKAFRYKPVPAPEAFLVQLGMKLRARLLRWARPRAEPVRFRDLPQVRSYPGGFDVARLGTFPAAAASSRGTA